MKHILTAMLLLLVAWPTAAAFAQDRDNDGLADEFDRRPTVATYYNNTAPTRVNPANQPAGVDSDNDGLPDYLDNRPYVMEYPNVQAMLRWDPYMQPMNIDTDRDGVPDRLDNRPYVLEYPYFGPYAQKPAEKPLAQAQPEPEVAKAPDTDNDGIPDHVDKCPETPARVEVDADGCPRDSDGDGVPDYKDKEVNSPKGASVDADGVALDSDNDGVIDLNDKCPGTARNVDVDDTGCPKLARKGEKITLQIEFATNSAEMTSQPMERLDGVAETMKQFPDIRIRIAGFTDNTGNDAHNLRLSQRRAKTVLDYLAGKGVERGRMSSTGFGENPQYFVGDNDTEEGRQKNRRVEIESVD